MPKLLKFDEFTLLICEKNVTNYALSRCKTFSLKNWLCKIFDKYHVWTYTGSSGQAIVRAGTFWGVLNVLLSSPMQQWGAQTDLLEEVKIFGAQLTFLTQL